MYNSIYMYMGSGKTPSHLSFSRLSIRNSVHRFGTEASKITMNCVISGYFNHRCSMAWHMDSKNSKGTTKQKVVLKISPNKQKAWRLFLLLEGGRKKVVSFSSPFGKVTTHPQTLRLHRLARPHKCSKDDLHLLLPSPWIAIGQLETVGSFGPKLWLLCKPFFGGHHEKHRTRYCVFSWDCCEWLVLVLWWCWELQI